MKEYDLDDEIKNLGKEIRARGVTLNAVRRTIYDMVCISTCSGSLHEFTFDKLPKLFKQIKEIPEGKRKQNRENVLNILKQYND